MFDLPPMPTTVSNRSGKGAGKGKGVGKGKGKGAASAAASAGVGAGASDSGAGAALTWKAAASSLGDDLSEALGHSAMEIDIDSSSEDGGEYDGGGQCVSNQDKPLPTEILLEDTGGLLSSPLIRSAGRSDPSVTSRCGSLLHSASADTHTRSSDDVIAF